MIRFEVVDASGDEGYIAIGNFPSLEAALSAIEERRGNGPEGLTDIYDDEITISIIEHSEGWGKPKFVWSRTWEASFENVGNRDGCTWSIVDPNDQ